MSENTGAWITDDLSDGSKAWLEGQPWVGGPSEVIARYALRSKADWDGEREERARVAAARERQRDAADALKLRGAEPGLPSDVIRRAVALSELADAAEERARWSETEEGVLQVAAAQQDRIRELERDSSRMAQNLTQANQGWSRARRQRETVDEYARSYGGGYYIR